MNTFAFLSALLLSAFVYAQDKTEITFSPQGTAKHVTQVRAHFSRPIAALGTSVSPFTIDCEGSGEGRWVTTQDWIFDFKEELKGGIACTYKLTNLKDLAGKLVESQASFHFNTGGPQITAIVPWANKDYVPTIDEDQLFQITTDAALDQTSLKKNLYFEIPQIANAVPAKIISIADVEKDNPKLAKELRALTPTPLLIQATTTFPSQKTIQLVWDKGVKSTGGVSARERQVFTYKVREPFHVTVRCTRRTEDAACSPFDDIYLDFSADPKDSSKVTIAGFPSGAKLNKDRPNSWIIKGPHVPGAEYKITLAKDFKDDADRPLTGGSEVIAKVGTQPPLIKFAANFGVVEWKANPVLPISIRRVELDTKVRVLKLPDNPLDLYKWRRLGRNTPESKELLPASLPERAIISLPRTKGHDAFEVKPIPFDGPGYYQLEVASAELSKAFEKTHMYVHTQVLVTDLAVHWKNAESNALVWVTSLASGESVPDADVHVYRCDGSEIFAGKTDKAGLLFYDKQITPAASCVKSKNEYQNEAEYLVKVTKGEDHSFVFSSDNEGIESWRFQLDQGNWEPLVVHSILDRSLLRAGETLSGLAVARTRIPKGYDFGFAAGQAKELTITHVGSEKKFLVPLAWDKHGNADFQWLIPKDAPLGGYILHVGSNPAGEFAVREFKIPTSRAIITAAVKKPVAARELKYAFDVSYLNGGAAGELPVKLRAEIRNARYQLSDEFESYQFNRGPPSNDQEDEGEVEEKNTLPSISLKLDKKGHGDASFAIPSLKRPQDLYVELEYPDANGQLRTTAITQTLNSANLLLGLAPHNTGIKEGGRYAFSGVALDLDQKSLFTKVKITRLKKTILSHRRRGIGGTYTYQHKVTLDGEKTICEVDTDSEGRFTCEVDFPESSQYLIVATASDAKGNGAKTYTEVWSSGDQYWYQVTDNDRIDLIPDKKHYEPGETAKILVKAPFPSGTLLYTTERVGIATVKTKAFDGKNPYIEVPVTRNLAPNFYVTAWLVRGRTKGTEPFLKVDLGKPAFKIGIVDLKVGYSRHKLDVKVKTDKQDYKTREQVKLSVDVRDPDGQIPNDGFVTIAAVDQGLLELEPNGSWNLLERMMGHIPYSSSHATDSLFVVGKRHFGLKSVAPGGGGGGRGYSRELFDTLLKWIARVPLKDGHADVVIPLNDSLTAFQLVAIAQSGTDLFGKAETTIQVSKDLSLTAGLPALAREGDRFKAEITVRNRSQAALSVDVSGAVSDQESLAKQTIQIPAGSSQIVRWDVLIPHGVSSLNYKFLATSSSGLSDSLITTQKVITAIPLQTLVSQIRQVSAPLDIALELPPDAKSGSIVVTNESSLGHASLESVRRFMESYPHRCLEQKLSRAVALGDKALWEKAEVASYFDKNNLLKFFGAMDEGSVELSAYVLELAHYQNWPLRDDDKLRIITGLQDFVKGKMRMKQKIHLTDAKIMAIAALALWDKSNAWLIQDLSIEPRTLDFSSLVHLYRISQIMDDVKFKSEVEAALNERLEFRGTVLQLKLGGYSLLGTADATLSRLLLTKLESKSDTSPDLPQLLRSLLASQKRGHWDATTSDALGTLAVQKFGAQFEKGNKTGSVSVKLGGETRTVKPNAAAETLIWPSGNSNVILTPAVDDKPWVSVTARGAIPITKAVGSGFQIEKSITSISSLKDGVHSVGDIYEVELKFRSNTRQDWTALSDPIPTGARILPENFAATYTEYGFEGMRAYFQELAPGEHSFKYRFQLNTSGSFQLPPTRIEAMYANEVFALSPNPEWKTQ